MEQNSIFIFTTELDEANTIVIRELQCSGYKILGIYLGAKFGGHLSFKKKIKRYWRFGIRNLLSVYTQKRKFNSLKKNNLSIEKNIKSICEKLAKVTIYKNYKEALHCSEAQKADIILLVHFNRIIPKSFLLKQSMVINLHLGELPKYRGVQPLFWSMLNREEFLYYTWHFVDEGIDTGDIVCSEKISKYSKSMFENRIILSKLAAKKIVKIIPEILSNKCSAKKQAGIVNYYNRPEKKDIDKFLKNNNYF